MGYYTDFSLTFKKEDKSAIKSDLKESIRQDLSDISGYTWYEDFCYPDIKWYNYHENMLELSKKYSDIIFRLIGNGEEFLDHWYIYYNNGKFQKTVIPEIVYEEFDKEKLI